MKIVLQGASLVRTNYFRGRLQVGSGPNFMFESYATSDDSSRAIPVHLLVTMEVSFNPKLLTSHSFTE